MAGEIQLNGTTALTESGGEVTLNNVDSATNRTNLGLGTAATSASTDFVGTSRTITAGTGLSGGGDLSTNRTINVSFSANESNVKTAINASGSAPIYACRAWVNFDGSGTVAIRNSGNVSSITDNSTIALYTVNFLTAMPDANYSVSGTAVSTIAGTGGTTGRVGTVSPNLNGTYSTSAVQVLTKDTADVHIDSSKVCVQVFR
jgi:hypothetical protein